MYVKTKFYVKIVYFLMLFKISTVSTRVDNTLNQSQIKQRITGGYRPGVHMLAKHMVSIRMNIYGVFQHNCGGSIIKPRVILTAAHCVTIYAQREIPVHMFEISVGTPLRFNNRDTKLFYVERIVVYPEYDDMWHKHDIALIYLTQDIEEDGKAQPVEIINEKPPEGTICTAAGWGRILNKGPIAEEVTYADLRIFAQNWCYKQFSSIYGEKIICAKGPDDKYTEKGICEGDSGGPLFCDGLLAGISSLGISECGSTGYVDIYTNVYYFRDWIENRAADSQVKFELFVVWAVIVMNLIM